jgi:pimeloyl-ACP methyl ester carboxylesterase
LFTLLIAPFPLRAQSEAKLSAGFASKDANVEGLKLYYTRSLPEADRKAYIDAYSRPGRMRAAWQYFVSWPQTPKDFAELSRTKLTMPGLSIGGGKSLGKELGQQMKLVGANVTVIVLLDTGHWILEERPKETTEALVKFL